MASGITNVGGNPGFNPALTATAGQVLVNRTFSADGKVILTGTMPDRGAANHSLAINGTFNIAAGYHNGSGNVTQSITTKGAQTFTPSTTNQTIAAGLYLTGTQTIAGDADLVPTNIKKDVNIYGVVGTVESKNGHLVTHNNISGNSDYQGGVAVNSGSNVYLIRSNTSSLYGIYRDTLDEAGTITNSTRIIADTAFKSVRMHTEPDKFHFARDSVLNTYNYSGTLIGTWGSLGSYPSHFRYRHSTNNSNLIVIGTWTPDYTNRTYIYNYRDGVLHQTFYVRGGLYARDIVHFRGDYFWILLSSSTTEAYENAIQLCTVNSSGNVVNATTFNWPSLIGAFKSMATW